MLLTDDQISSYKELGYLFIENAFDSNEVSKMNKELPSLYNLDRPEIQKEKVRGETNSKKRTDIERKKNPATNQTKNRTNAAQMSLRTI